MRTQVKIMILLILTIGTFSVVFLGYQFIKDRQEKLFINASIQSKNLVIDNIQKFKSKSYLGPVNDYSCWDEMIGYVKNPTKQWEEINLSTLESFGFSYVWIFDKDVKSIYSTFDSTIFNGSYQLSKENILHALNDNGTCHFFLNERDTLLEITGGTIVPSSDINHKTIPNGYFLAAKFWSKKYIHEMESEMDFSIHFRTPEDSVNTIQKDKSTITISKKYKDSFGKDVMTVDYISKNQLAKDFLSTNRMSYALIVLLIFTILVFFIAIRRWISKPLVLITKSLNNENDIYVSSLLNKKDEFGEIATLINKFFDQKIQLEVEIAERIETQQTVKELYEDTVNLNHELQASEEELRQNLDMTIELNEVLSKQQREITDSINYASKIQAALLPPIESIKHLERDFFVLYKPRNIVSGDFYWINHKRNKTIIAVADCTGHGVPGGFMSMLGMAYLAEIVNLNYDFTSGEILDQLRKRVVDSLHQYGKSGESKDGMDIALCIIDFERMTLQFSGAYNPLYIVRKSINPEGLLTSELIEIKGDRMPIGYSLKLGIPFTSNESVLQKDDVLYLVTDGYQDQISNTTRHKFKRSRLRELLVEIHDRDFEDQKNILEIAFDEYREDYPQIDDVLAFGMKI
jgi:serine phosphatase RsbU (regulator of sigma subunit)